MLACDLAIAGDKAAFGQIEVMGGVMPGFGGTWRLARRVGFQRACEMMFTSAVIDAATALQAAKALAARIALTSRTSVATIKRVANAGWNRAPEEIDTLEDAAFAVFNKRFDVLRRDETYHVSERQPALCETAPQTAVAVPQRSLCSPCLGGRRKRGQQNQALGRSRGGFASKIHLKTDFDGLPIAFHLTGGEVSDSTHT